ncbi:BON domain-containing protein [Maribacter sp. ACAM166]|uniref:BON domain-containing protein n=1 Tax=Maribacter sp. ACAM166 TaxID=2508996 RepID=UPI0010FF544A|nr:BON domain-containing protein [Maribacter sp. ACAM166]
MAKAICDTFEWNTAVPKEDITIKVEDGWIYLSGDVSWEYQRKAAKHVVENLLGVKGVINSLKIKQDVKA